MDRQYIPQNKTPQKNPKTPKKTPPQQKPHRQTNKQTSKNTPHREKGLKYSSSLTCCSNIPKVINLCRGFRHGRRNLGTPAGIKTTAYIVHLSNLLPLTCLVSLAVNEAVCPRKHFHEEHLTTSGSKGCFAMIPLLTRNVRSYCSEGTQSAMLFPSLSAAQMMEGLDLINACSHAEERIS